MKMFNNEVAGRPFLTTNHRFNRHDTTGLADRSAYEASGPDEFGLLCACTEPAVLARSCSHNSMELDLRQ